jgi:16S rRNA G966 N2-methylase RsmD
MTLSIAQLKRIATTANVPEIQNNYSRIAKIHKYWSRKPWSVIDHFINTYSQLGQVVLDPFCGSGVIGLQALKAGRNFIGSDLNPFAVRLTQETLDIDFDEKLFDSALNILRVEVMESITDLYRIEDDIILFSVPNQLEFTTYNAAVKKTGSTKTTKIQIDLNLLPKISFNAEDDLELPDQNFPAKFYKDRFSYKGISKVSQLFSDRNLYALSILNRAITQLDIKSRKYFELCLTNTLLHVSKLKSERVRPLGVNNYWIPDDYIEENVWWRFEDRCKQFALAKRTIANSFASDSQVTGTKHTVKIGDATKLSSLEDNTIDYILTDPPYGEAIQYSELSLVWNCWLRQTYLAKNEIIVNPEQNKNQETYSSLLNAFIIEASRVLRLNASMTISFHSKDIELWGNLARSLYESGFDLTDLYISQGVGSPFTKNWAKFSPKSDIYITILNSRTAGRKLIESSGQEFIQSLGKYVQDISSNQQQLYDFIVLATIAKTMSGTYLSGLHQKNMSSLLTMLAASS